MSTQTKNATDLYTPVSDKVNLGQGNFYHWDQLRGSGFLGTWTKADEANLNLRLSDAEWLRNLELMDYQNWYNSPEQQAIRMRQAGLNPDLQGVNGSIPSSGASVPKTSVPAGTNNIDTGIQLAGAFLQTISIGHKLAESVTKVVGGNIANQATRVNEIFKNMGSFLGQIAPAGVPVLDPDGNLSEATHQILDINQIKAFDSLFPRGKSRKMAHTFLQAFQDSDFHKQLWYGLRGTTEEKRRNLLSWLGSSQYKSLDVILMDGLGKVYDIARDADISRGVANKAINDFNTNYYNTKDGVSAGKKDNWVNHRASNFETIRTDSIEAFNKVIKPLERNRPVLFNIATAIAPVLIDYFLGLSFAGYND